MNLENRIKEILNELNMKIKNAGYRCWVEAVKYVVENKRSTYCITIEIYPTVAEKVESMPHRVERAMRHAYENNKEEIQKYFNVKYKIDNSALLALIVDKLKREEEEYGHRKSDDITADRV